MIAKVQNLECAWNSDLPVDISGIDDTPAESVSQFLNVKGTF